MQSPQTFEVPQGQRQLFLDDHGVAQTTGLTSTMHQPAKKGAVIRPNPAAGETVFQIRSAPSWDEQAQAYLLPVGSSGEGTWVWQSQDGLHWTRRGKSSMYLWSIVADPTEPDPARRYKALLPTLVGQPGGNGVAVSPDMLNWTTLDVPAVESSDEWNVSLDTQDHLFLATVKIGGPGRQVGLATSPDGLTWTEHGVVFQADEEDQRRGRENILARRDNSQLQRPLHFNESAYNVDVYNMGIFRYEGLYVGIPVLYHSTGDTPNYPNTDGFDLLQLLCSRDLLIWQRLGHRETFLGPSPLGAGAYDLTQIMPPSVPIVRGDQLWLYYTGLKYRDNGPYVGTYPDGEFVHLHEFDPDYGAICLALLRRDGFVSLDAGEQPGTLLTEAFVLPGTKLHVNVDATEGALTVEVLDASGQVVAASAETSGDLPAGEITWQTGDLGAAQGQPVSLRFTLRQGSLYSYWVEA